MELVCRRCGLKVDAASMWMSPTTAVKDAERDWYIEELES